MKFLRGTLIGLFCLVVGFLVVWQPLPSQAQGAAPAKGKPALYDFGAEHVHPLQGDGKSPGGPSRASMATRWKCAWSMRKRNAALFKQYKIMLIPTQVFLDASGKEVDRHIGALPKEELIKKAEGIEVHH